MEIASRNPGVARITTYSDDIQIYEILLAIWEAKTKGLTSATMGKKKILVFLLLSQIPAAWLLTLHLLPLFPEEINLMKLFFCPLLSHLLKSLPIFNQTLRTFQRFETPMPCKNWVWMEERDPNQCHYRRKCFRVCSLVTCFAQPAHSGLLHNNLPSWIRVIGRTMQVPWCSQGSGQTMKSPVSNDIV